VLLLLLWTAACTFAPESTLAIDPSLRPDVAAPDAGRTDATAEDATQPVDGSTPDAGEDAGYADVSAADAEAADALADGGDAMADATADASPPDATADSGTRDAAADAAGLDAQPTDARADAGRPDASPGDARAADASAIDAGPTPDGGCPTPPWPVAASPQSVATFAVPMGGVDLPPLVADFDADGHDEVAVASTTQATLTIFDWPACSSVPDVTTSPVFVGPAGLALAQAGGRDVIVSASFGSVSLMLYNGPNQLTPLASPMVGFTNLYGLAAHPTGTEILLSGVRPQGNAYVSLRVAPNARAVGAPTVESPAYLGGAPGAAQYLVLTTGGAVVAQPDQPSDAQVALNHTPLTSPATLDGRFFQATGIVAAAHGATAGTPGLGWVSVDLASPALSRTEFLPSASQSQSRGAPIAYAEVAPPATGSAGFFQIRDAPAGGDLVVGCTVSRQRPPGMGFDCLGVPTPLVLPGSAASQTTPITVYASGALSPDLLIVTQTPPRMVFARPDLQAITTLTLTGAPVATPAASTTFLARYNTPGTMVFVVREDSIELVAWRRPPLFGSTDLLWTQSRANARRTGKL
jgi:hypothetical protein